MNQVIPPAIVEEVQMPLFQIEAFVKRGLNELQQEKEKLKNYRESISNMLQNDKEFTELEEQERQIKLKVKVRKAQILQTPEGNRYDADAKETSERIKELKGSVSVGLQSYVEKSKLTTIEIDDHVYDIKSQFNLKGRKA